MAKVISESMTNFNQHYPKIALIVTASAGGKESAMPAAWHTSICIDPPLYGVSLASSRFTYQLIAESKEFGLNFIPWEKANLAGCLGGVSGREINKFEKFNIEKEKPLKTGVPILKDAYAAYECQLVDDRLYGDHNWVVGKIVAVHFLEEAFDEKHLLDASKMKPLLYLGADFYATQDGDSTHYVKRGL
ncbi:MAG: flavin reductase [Dehalococcoidia bacterium]|nr:flavin reductase [Dehalococcoidia bacterium]